jgi:hypothetical protein
VSSYRHGKAEPNKELLLLELKMEHFIVGGAKRDPLPEYTLFSMLA